MTMWTHNICEVCWDAKNPDRAPWRIKDDRERVCCFCGKENQDGIYVREDPKILSCNHEENEE